MKSTKFYMWVTDVDLDSNILRAEGHLIEENKLSNYKHGFEVDIDYLKQNLSEEMLNEMINIDGVDGFSFGRIFYLEQFDDENKEDIITLYHDKRSPEKIKKDKEAAMNNLDELMKNLKEE